MVHWLTTELFRPEFISSGRDATQLWGGGGERPCLAFTTIRIQIYLHQLLSLTTVRTPLCEN